MSTELDNLDAMLQQAFAKATEIYRERGFQRRIGFGRKPALINVDLANAWTRPGNPFTCEKIDDQIIPGVQQLLAACRANAHVVVHTTTCYQVTDRDDPHTDMGLWHHKIPIEATQVVTYVSVEGAHESDQHAVIPVVEALEANDCKPKEMVADTNYGRGQNIVDAAEHDVELTSPACGTAPQPAEGEGTRDDFEFSADGQRLERCPQGHAPIEQGPSGPNGTRRTARMDTAPCADCPLLQACPMRFHVRAETMTFTWSPAEGATTARRRAEQTPAFKIRYRIRSGIEAMNSEYKGPYCGGRLRVRGHPAVTRTVKFKFIALNLRRRPQPLGHRNPSPLPSPINFVVKNGSNTLGKKLAGIPVPVSAILISMPSA